MKLSGSYQINLYKEKVWEALNDPEILKNLFQAVKNLEKTQKQNLLPLPRIKLDLLMLVLQVISS